MDLRTIAEKISNNRVDLKSHQIKYETAQSKLNDAGINIEELDLSKYENLKISELEDLLNEIQVKIVRLGAINLAAPEEIAEESKEKNDLDEQYQDLEEALAKLSDAVKKIDQETKTIFKESF